MYVRLTGGRPVLGRWSRSGATSNFLPPERDKAGKITKDSVYFVHDDAWSPAEKDVFLGPMESEVDAVERNEKGNAVLKSGKPIPILGADGKQRKEWVPDAKNGRRNGGVFEVVPDAEVSAAERKSKEAKAVAIAAKVKAGKLPADALTDYRAFLPKGVV